MRKPTVRQPRAEVLAARMAGLRASLGKRAYLPKERGAPMICTPDLMKRAIAAAAEDKRRIRADNLRFLGQSGQAGMDATTLGRR